MSFPVRFHRLPGLTWVGLSLAVGAAIVAALFAWSTRGLDERVVRDVLLLAVGPAVLALAYGRDLGWHVDRRVLRNTAVLLAFVLPFYLVGSSLPTVREFYPMWGLDTAAPGSFLPHAVKQLLLVIAAETYFRGLLCVGVRDIGFKSVFISPIVYALLHVGKPPIELLLSGPTDVLFGAVDYQCRSIVPSIVAHGFGLALLDWLVLRPPLVDQATVARWLSWLPVQV